MSSGLWISPSDLGGSFSTDEMAGDACQLASFILWAATGRKYGRARTVTETYECACSLSKTGPAFMPYRLGVAPTLIDGAVVNTTCGCIGVSGGRHTRLRLSGRPVRRVHSVHKGSVELDPSTYSVQNSGLLTLAQGSPNDVCGLTVTYSYGTGIPGGGRMAAKLLSEEFLRSWNGDADCRLPDRVTNVSRQGVSFSIIDRQEFVDELRTGILEIDMFLRAVNPARALKPARVFSPDLPKAYRTTANYTPESLAHRPRSRTYDFEIFRGEEVERGFRSYGEDGQAVDLTGLAWQATMHESGDSGAPTFFDLTPYLMQNGTDPSLLELRLSSTDTGALAAGQYYWEARLDGVLWLHGQVLVMGEDTAEGA